MKPHEENWSLCCDGDCSCLTVSKSDSPVLKIYSGEWGDEYPALRFVEGTTGFDQKVEAYNEMITYGYIELEYAKKVGHLVKMAPDMYRLLEKIKNGKNPDINEIDSVLKKANGEI